MKKLVRLLMCSLPLLVLAACGGGGGGDPAPAAAGAAPKVTSITPADSTVGVIASTAIKVTFSKAMKLSTVTASTALEPTTGQPNGTFTVSYITVINAIDTITNTAVTINKTNIVQGTLTADATNKVFTFTPAPPSLAATDPITGTPLHTSRTYTVTIKGGVNGQSGVQEAGGTVMVNNVVSTFNIWAGTQQSGTLFDDVVNGVGVDSDGNSYLAGYTNGSLGVTNPDGSGQTSDILLVKYDANGELAWTRQLASQTPAGQPGSYDDKIFGSAFDSVNSQIVVAGYTDGTLNQFSQVSPVGVNPDESGATHNYCVVKYDVDGNLMWAAQAGSGPAVSLVNSVARAVATDKNGAVYVAGETYGNLRSTTTFTSNYNGGADVFVAKYAASGSLLWTTLIGTSSDDIATGISVDANSNVYVTGRTAGGLFGANHGGNDVFVAKLNAFGALNNALSAQFGTALDDHANAITTDSFGNVYVVGGTYGSLFGNNADNTATAGTTSDLFVRKSDALGNVIWTRQFGTVFSDDATGVVTDPFGNVYVTGYTFGGLDGNPGSGGAEVFLIKYNSDGVKQWTKQLGATAVPPQLDAVTVGQAIGYNNNSLYVGGYTAGNLDSNFNLDVNFGTNDYFLVRYDAITGLRY